MPHQEVQAFLQGIQTSDRVRAAAWDAVYNVADDAGAEQALRQLPLGDDVKATLWDYRTKAGAETSSQPEGSAIGRFLSNAGEMLNPVTAVRGLAHAVQHPIDTATALYNAQAEQFGKAGEALRGGRPVEAFGHGLASVVPVLGPMAANVGEQVAEGDVAGGLGAATGLLGGAALAGSAARTAGRVVRPAAQRGAEVLYQSALKPTKAVLKDVRTPVGSGADAARRTLVQTGLREEIPISPRGAQKVENLIDSLNSEVEARLKAATARGEKVDPTLVEQKIAEVANDFTNQVNAQPDLAAIETVRSNFMANPNVSQKVTGPAGTATVTKDIPIETAQEMKRNTYRGLRGKYGTERSATIEAEKAGARGLKEGIEAGAPEVAALNAREGQAIPLEHAIADAMRRRGNYGIFGLTPVVAAMPAVMHGSLWPLLAAMVDRMPGVVSRTGIWMNRAGTGTGRGARVAGRAAVTGTATNPNESRSRTRGRGQLSPAPAQ